MGDGGRAKGGGQWEEGREKISTDGNLKKKRRGKETRNRGGTLEVMVIRSEKMDA